MGRPEEIVNEIVAKMQECGLGMRRKTVELSGHSGLWASAFLWFKDKIRGHLRNVDAYRVEHFGSTSIPNIAACSLLKLVKLPSKPVFKLNIIIINDCQPIQFQEI